jgi:hypothetical protein
MEGLLELIGWCATCGREIRLPTYWTGHQRYPTWHEEAIWNPPERREGVAVMFVATQELHQPPCCRRPHRIVSRTGGAAPEPPT